MCPRRETRPSARSEGTEPQIATVLIAVVALVAVACSSPDAEQSHRKGEA